MKQCSHIKENGQRCMLYGKEPADGSETVCWHHSPQNATERRRTASRGGRGRVNAQVRAVKSLMDELTTKVLAGEVEPSVSHAVVAMQNIKLRAIETERRLGEDDVRAEFENLKSVLVEHGVLLPT